MDNSDVFVMGERVRLRAFREDDLDAAYSYLRHPDLDGRRYLPRNLPPRGPLTRDHVRQAIQDWGKPEKRIVAAITTREEDRVIGHVGGNWSWDPLLASVLVVVDTQQQRQGYASEALQLIVRHIYENLPANNISMWVSDWNESGLAFGRSQGFQACGTIRRVGMRNGRYYGQVVMDLLRREWGKEGKDGA